MRRVRAVQCALKIHSRAPGAASLEDDVLPAGWERRQHEGRGRVFFKNVVTGVKQYDHPSDKKKPPSTGGAAPPEDDVLPAGWERRQSEGKVFFKNVMTNVKQWDHPSGKNEPPSTGSAAGGLG